MDEIAVKRIVELTIENLMDKGIIKTNDDVLYANASEILKDFYKSGSTDSSVNYALQTIRFDPYFRIVLMYYQDGMTIQEIAEALDVDVSTVTRNKKRLCLEVYKQFS